jgi:hypothetical protein
MHACKLPIVTHAAVQFFFVFFFMFARYVKRDSTPGMYVNAGACSWQQSDDHNRKVYSTTLCGVQSLA